MLLFGPGAWSAAENASPENQDEEQDVLFTWALGALLDKDAEPRLVPIGKDMSLEGDARIRMLLELKKNCFVYVIYHDSNGEVNLLFPYDLEKSPEDLQLFKPYHIPQGEEWIKLDGDVKLVRFYLLASTERLYDLEALIGDYASAKPEKKTGMAEEIRSTILQLRKERGKYRTYERPAARIIGVKKGLLKPLKTRCSKP